MSKYPCTVITVAAFDDIRLKKTFESILDLKERIEYIVVVPKSDFLCRQLFKEYQPKFQFDSRILFDVGQGIYQAMNIGGAAAGGRFIIYWNAGDLILDVPEFSKFIKLIEEVSEKWIIFGAKIDWSRKPEISEKTPRQFIAQSKRGYISHQQIAVNRQAFLDFGMFDLRYRIAADFKVIAKLSKFKPFLAQNYCIVEVEKPYLSSISNKRGRLETFIILCKIWPPNLMGIVRILNREFGDFLRLLQAHKFGLSVKIR